MRAAELTRVRIAWGLGLFCPVLLGLMVASSPAQAGIAVGVGGEPPTQFEAIAGSAGGYEIHVGTENEPIPIFLDPAAEPWPKWIDITVTPNNPLDTNAIIPVWEHILVTPDPTGRPSPGGLIDWHEEVHPDPTGALLWQWTSGTLTAPGPNAPIDVKGQIDGNKIWFEWDTPLLPNPDPFPVWIHKELQYLGDPIRVPQGVDSVVVPVHLWEHPTITPEPAAMVVWSMLAMTGLGLVSGRRWRQSRRLAREMPRR